MEGGGRERGQKLLRGRELSGMGSQPLPRSLEPSLSELTLINRSHWGIQSGALPMDGSAKQVLGQLLTFFSTCLQTNPRKCFLASQTFFSAIHNFVRNSFQSSVLRLILYLGARLLLHSLCLVETLTHCAGILLYAGPSLAQACAFYFLLAFLVCDFHASDFRQNHFFASLAPQGSYYFLLGNVSNFDGWQVLFAVCFPSLLV